MSNKLNTQENIICLISFYGTSAKFRLKHFFLSLVECQTIVTCRYVLGTAIKHKGKERIFDILMAKRVLYVNG